MTKLRNTLRAAVPVAALALALTACGPENDDPAVTAAPTSAPAGGTTAAPTGAAPTSAPAGGITAAPTAAAPTSA
ncbi:serine protease, partial [Kitasatospora purpeofusca]